MLEVRLEVKSPRGKLLCFGVSILIVLEVRLEVADCTLAGSSRNSFNPYCAGSQAGRGTGERIMGALLRVSILIVLEVRLEAHQFGLAGYR